MVETHSHIDPFLAKSVDFAPFDLSSADVVVMGGGTGSSMVLRALKGRVGTLKNIFTPFDDGGASEIVRRDEIGEWPAVGDGLANFLALLDETNASPEDINELREVMGHRFANLRKLGNDMTHAGMEKRGSLTGSFEFWSKWFRTQGIVMPVSEDSRHLVLKLSDERTIYGEHRLDDPKLEPDIPSDVLVEVDFDGPTRINPAAAEAIKEADLVILGPGSLYGSIGAVCTKNIIEMTKTLKSARLLMTLVNIMNDRHTRGLDVAGNIARINHMAGAKIVQLALYHNQPIDPNTREIYEANGETSVEANLDNIIEGQKTEGYLAIGADLIAHLDKNTKKDPRDLVHRSLARHNQDILYRAIEQVVGKPVALTLVN